MGGIWIWGCTGSCAMGVYRELVLRQGVCRDEPFMGDEETNYERAFKTYAAPNDAAGTAAMRQL